MTSHLHRYFFAALTLFFPLAAQVRNPVTDASDAIIRARSEGRLADIPSIRDAARKFLDTVPDEHPHFAGWAGSVSREYTNARRNPEALAVLENALQRPRLSAEGRAQLLLDLANLWRTSGNPLKAMGYLDRAALLKTPARKEILERAIDVSLELGHTKDADRYREQLYAILAKNRVELAQFYTRDGQIEQAAAIYRSDSQQGEPADRIEALQSLARLRQGQGRTDDAAVALRQAVGLAPTNNPRHPRMWLQSALASCLRDAGSLQEADEVLAGMLAENRNEQTMSIYADHLSFSGRRDQAIRELKEFTASNSGAYGAIALGKLAALLREAGDEAGAVAYGKMAEERQRAPSISFSGMRFIPRDPDLVLARTAAGEGRSNDALTLGLKALAKSSSGMPGGATYEVAGIAGTMAQHGDYAIAVQLFEQYVEAAEERSADTFYPAYEFASTYANFLMREPKLRNLAPEAIARFRAIMLASRGPESSGLVEAAALEMNYERLRESKDGALLAARNLLAIEETLSGTTGLGYLTALEKVMGLHEQMGNRAAALPLRLRMIEIADLVYRADNGRPADLRVEAAMAMRNEGRRDEAIRLATEALALAASLHPSRRSHYALMLKEFQR